MEVGSGPLQPLRDGTLLVTELEDVGAVHMSPDGIVFGLLQIARDVLQSLFGLGYFGLSALEVLWRGRVRRGHESGPIEPNGERALAGFHKWKRQPDHRHPPRIRPPGRSRPALPRGPVGGKRSPALPNIVGLIEGRTSGTVNLTFRSRQEDRRPMAIPADALELSDRIPRSRPTRPL
jgi:hypothetical protein